MSPEEDALEREEKAEARRLRRQQIEKSWREFLRSDAWQLDLKPELERIRRQNTELAADLRLSSEARAVVCGINQAVAVLLHRPERALRRLAVASQQPRAEGIQQRPPRATEPPGLIA